MLKNVCAVSINIEDPGISNQQIHENHVGKNHNLKKLRFPKRFYSGFCCISLALGHVDLDRFSQKCLRTAS
jgi:hypothetical protein